MIHLKGCPQELITLFTHRKQTTKFSHKEKIRQGGSDRLRRRSNNQNRYGRTNRTKYHRTIGPYGYCTGVVYCVGRVVNNIYKGKATPFEL